MGLAAASAGARYPTSAAAAAASARSDSDSGKHQRRAARPWRSRGVGALARDDKATVHVREDTRCRTCAAVRAQCCCAGAQRPQRGGQAGGRGSSGRARLMMGSEQTFCAKTAGTRRCELDLSCY